MLMSWANIYAVTARYTLIFMRYRKWSVAQSWSEMIDL
jgi:hypothetical protein